MKRIYPKKNQPVKASEIDRDGSKEQSKQTTLSTGRVRSLATIGLAISVGASGILLPRSGDSARASELAPIPEPTAEVQAASASELATSVGDAPSATPTAEPSNPVAVKVQPGQTLWELSQDYAVAPNSIATANGIESDTLLQVGQKLTIGPAEVVASSQQNADNTPVAAPPDYVAVVNPEQKLDLTGSEPSSSPVVQSGPPSTAANPLETLTPEQNSIVAPNTNGAIDSLKKQENRTAEFGQTQLGSELPTSLSTSTLSLQSPAPTQVSSTSATRTVIPNAGFDQANSSIEQSLVTPSLPSAVVVPSAGTTPVVTDVTYSVRPGDTLGAIASSQGVKVQDLISINKLGNPNFLNVNQRLKIPQVALNNPAVQAPASIQASNSTSSFSTASVPGSLNPSSSTPEIPGSGVTVSAPTVPIVSPLANLEGLNNISAPMVPQINNISLTQVSQNISDPRKLEIPGEPTFTGAVDTSALPMPATATASSTLTGAYPQPANWTPVVNTQGLATETANAVPESSAATQSTQELSPYAERLRAEVVRLREEYRAERNSIGPNSVALVPTADSETQVAAGNPSEDNEQLNPYLYTPEYRGTVQNEISRPPSRGWSEEVQKQQQERLDAARAAQSQPLNLTPASNLDRPVVATAPLGSQGYDPLSNPSLGQMVSPELPPLSGADTYLPKGSRQQSANGFIWPAKGVFTSGYGWRWGRMHKGIDVAGPIGTPIVAAADGVVTYAQWNDGGYGHLVEITHPDGTETVYAHNSRILVQKGQRVAQGEQISEMGSTGFSTGPHLHFEIHPAGSGAVNPMAFLPKDDSSASR
ncbi:MAG: peptidoglycan DD-metalloendopeptidase family protein [Tychonema bourrellyi B0820]|uniref:Peptidase M23 n=1 Tax=Tychonema bourrellyi FEM_GT703 TaxID=2040638 RepID=A0A2G4EYH3_9CYAN|nr:peptidoglycan DD-metalloendopeptidase family protein [Tychonema bourrellyi]MDQ2097970.1 peptidoglycan DD-metalloendopeptidase family protein [Tychonema bourrellyi B0820]PHX54582.1 peptidase M23 [Tychonema bourrellyi FEM_GT703]